MSFTAPFNQLEFRNDEDGTWNSTNHNTNITSYLGHVIKLRMLQLCSSLDLHSSINYVSKYHEIENDGENGLILLNISYEAFKDKRVEFEKNIASKLPITFYNDKSFLVNGKLPHFNDGLYKEDADFVLFVMYSKGRFERWDYRLNRRTGELIESVSFLSDESNNNYAHSIPRSYQCVRAEGLF